MTDEKRNQHAYDNARAWIKKGYRVHPIHTAQKSVPVGNDYTCTCGKIHSFSSEKRPILDGWNEKASCNLSVIEEWLHPKTGKYRGSNVGLLTGRDVGFIVLDVDGEVGLADLEYLQGKYGVLPETFTVATPGGGQHHYFKYPRLAETEYIPTITRLKLPDRKLNIDVRGDRSGYVLAPDCVRFGGGTYTVIKDVPVAPLPIAFLPILVRQKNVIVATAATPAAPGASTSEDTGKQPAPTVETLLAECAYLRHCHAEHATLGRDDWLAMLTLIVRCENGHAWSHELSKGHPSYTVDDCDKNIDEALNNMGPRTCAKIAESFAECADCKWRHAATSPLQINTGKARDKITDAHLDELNVADAETTSDTGQETKATPPPDSAAPSPDEGAALLPTVSADTPMLLSPPPGYRFESGNVEVMYKDDKGKRKWRIVIWGLLGIKEISHNIHEEDTHITLAYERPGITPIEFQIPRSYLADIRTLAPHLAGKNLPVSGKSTEGVAAYLTNYQLHVEARLPLRKLSSHCGWVGDVDDKVFLFGNRCIGGDLILDPKFDDGLVIDGLIPQGSIERWSALYGVAVKRFQIMHFCLLGALSSPLLKILSVDSFWIELAGKTSSGKTVALQLSASVWGDPKALVGTWATTRNAAERRASLLNCFPLILNEAQAWPHLPSGLVQVFYALTEGRSKQRARPDGMQQSLTWRLVCFSSSEAPIADYTAGAGGVHSRTISFLDPPSGAERSPQVGTLIRQLLQTAHDNHGIVGHAFIEWLVQQDFEEIRVEFRVVMEELEKSTASAFENSTVAVRMLPYFAAIELAGRLVHRAVPELGPYHSPVVDAMEKTIRQSTREADQPVEAMRVVVDWLYENQFKFCPGTEDPGGPLVQTKALWLPPVGANGECMGIWNHHCAEWDSVYVLRSLINKVLEGRGYSPTPILRGWRDRGWLIADGKDRFRYRLTIADGTKKGTKKSFLRITRTALDEVAEADG